MKSYAVKEIFYSLQGEGYHSGRAAILCRFTGCNLWSGRETDRANALCAFCDTDFVGVNGLGGGQFSIQALVDKIIATWPSAQLNHRYIVCTGGEPLLQLDFPLIEAFHQVGFEVAIETNGTLAAPEGIDWICVSPKGHAPLVLKKGHELKLVYPQPEAPPEHFEDLEFETFFCNPWPDLKVNAIPS